MTTNTHTHFFALPHALARPPTDRSLETCKLTRTRPAAACLFFLLDRQYRGACPASRSDSELLELVKKMGGDEAKIQSALEDWWQSESPGLRVLCVGGGSDGRVSAVPLQSVSGCAERRCKPLFSVAVAWSVS